MNRFLFLLVLTCTSQAIYAQYVYTIKADSVKITNSCDTAELIIENHTQNVPGFLYNKGRGRTEFRRVLQNLSDSTFLIGGDTLKLSNIWLQGGNRFGTIGKFGTLDNNHIDFYTNNTKWGRWANTGNLLIGTETDAGPYKLQVDGKSYFTNDVYVVSDSYYISIKPHYQTGYGPSTDASMIAFGNIYGSIGVNKQNLGNIPANSLLVGGSSPGWWTAVTDYRLNPTIIVPGEGPVAINGGWRGIDNGGSRGFLGDMPGYSLDLNGGRGTGNGIPGDIIFSTGNVQPSGTTIHNLSLRWTIKGGTGFLSNSPNPTSLVDVNATNGYSQFRLRTSYTPASTADTNGNVGDFSWDDNYFYIKTSTGWKRSALSSF